MNFLLIRHCSAEGQASEAALTPAGVEQSKPLAEFLAEQGITQIVSSPFRRAVSSAQPTAVLLNLPIELDERLAERKLGIVENGDWQTALKESFENLTLTLPEGESSETAIIRARAVVDRYLKESDKKTAFFTHGNLLSLLVHSYDSSLGFDFWKNLSNPDVVEVNLDQSTIKKIWDKRSA